MFQVVDKVVFGMAGIRMISSLVEMSGALLMLYFGTASKALQVNAGLALVGPLVLVTVTTLGVIGVADEISWGKIVCIIIGIAFILVGARS